MKIEKNMRLEDIAKEIEKELKEHDVYIISSVGGKGHHIGRFKTISVDANGDLIIESDIDEVSITR